MTVKKVEKKTYIIFTGETFTDKELKESSLADLCFVTILQNLQAQLEPKKFRPARDNDKIKKT